MPKLPMYYDDIVYDQIWLNLFVDGQFGYNLRKKKKHCLTIPIHLILRQTWFRGPYLEVEKNFSSAMEKWVKIYIPTKVGVVWANLKICLPPSRPKLIGHTAIDKLFVWEK